MGTDHPACNAGIVGGVCRLETAPERLETGDVFAKQDF
jgi:hypothetical protein